MVSDRQLRAEVVSALESVTPPAPWLESAIGESLRARSRQGGWKMVITERFAGRGLSVAVAVALVLLLGATAVGIFALRSISHPVTAHPNRSAAVRYAELLKSDKQILDDAVGREVTLGSIGTFCDTLAHTECPAVLARVVAAQQRQLDDLDRTTPPPQFAGEHGRMKADLHALIVDLNLAAAAFKAGDLDTSTKILSAGLMLRDEMLTIQAYVVYESSGDKPARDAATAAYAALIGQDYDNLQLQALFTSLLNCNVNDAACAPSVASTRRATEAFLADLQARTPPTQFLSIHGDLVRRGLEVELQRLDELDAAYASRNETALDLAKLNANNAHGRIITYVGGILYAH
jgi:hypothetical protein